MLTEFNSFAEQHNLLDDDQPCLVAVSGGLDSITLCALMREAGKKFGIAHCNFKLRGEAADGDALFVRKLAEHYKVTYFEIEFDTIKLAKERQQSIQLAARELRYEWLERILVKHGFASIATAHHLNDSIETVLYNFTKGCGLRGLHGIPIRSNHVIRPLLFASRAQIEAFAQSKGLAYREDASNAEDKYIRNKIRHHIVPVLQSINPALEERAATTLALIREAEAIYDWGVKYWRDQLVKEQDGNWYIDIRKRKEVPAFSSLLYEWLSPLGFNAAQLEQALERPEERIGRQFLSPTHSLWIDRGVFIVSERQQGGMEESKWLEGEKGQLEWGDGRLHWEVIERPAELKRGANQALLAMEKLKFPLQLRAWQAGDRFQPLGMKSGHQKVK